MPAATLRSRDSIRFACAAGSANGRSRAAALAARPASHSATHDGGGGAAPVGRLRRAGEQEEQAQGVLARVLRGRARAVVRGTVEVDVDGDLVRRGPAALAQTPRRRAGFAHLAPPAGRREVLAGTSGRRVRGEGADLFGGQSGQGGLRAGARDATAVERRKPTTGDTRYRLRMEPEPTGAPASAPEPAAPQPAVERAGDDGGRPLVALLAATAAVVIAILGVRASFLGSEASAAWQTAVRQEVKRAAATVEDIRYLYENEALPALQLVKVQLLEEEYQRAADAAADGPVEDALEAEAGRYRQLLDLYRAGSLIASDPKYALEGGGYDLVARLIDLRNRNPELVTIDPERLEAAGDAASAKASQYLRAAIPVSADVPLRRARERVPAPAATAARSGRRHDGDRDRRRRSRWKRACCEPRHRDRQRRRRQVPLRADPRRPARQCRGDRRDPGRGPVRDRPGRAACAAAGVSPVGRRLRAHRRDGCGHLVRGPDAAGDRRDQRRWDRAPAGRVRAARSRGRPERARRGGGRRGRTADEPDRADGRAIAAALGPRPARGRPRRPRDRRRPHDHRGDRQPVRADRVPRRRRGQPPHRCAQQPGRPCRRGRRPRDLLAARSRAPRAGGRPHRPGLDAAARAGAPTSRLRQAAEASSSRRRWPSRQSPEDRAASAAAAASSSRSRPASTSSGRSNQSFVSTCATRHPAPARTSGWLDESLHDRLRPDALPMVDQHRDPVRAVAGPAEREVAPEVRLAEPLDGLDAPLAQRRRQLADHRAVGDRSVGRSPPALAERPQQRRRARPRRRATSPTRTRGTPGACSRRRCRRW